MMLPLLVEHVLLYSFIMTKSALTAPSSVEEKMCNSLAQSPFWVSPVFRISVIPRHFLLDIQQWYVPSKQSKSIKHQLIWLIIGCVFGKSTVLIHW